MAYLRALNSPFADDLRKPAFVAKLVEYLSRTIDAYDPSDRYDYNRESRGKPRPVVWNGNVLDENCLVGYPNGYVSEKAKSVCGKVNANLPQPGNTDNWTPPGANNGGGSGGGAITWSVHVQFPCSTRWLAVSPSNTDHLTGTRAQCNRPALPIAARSVPASTAFPSPPAAPLTLPIP